MTGRFDDLPQESWDSACEHMPTDYADEVQTLFKRYQPLNREPKTDAEVKELGYELNVIETKLDARRLPRFGQPSFDAPLVDWYREFKFRRLHPLWYEREYRYSDDGELVHAKK